MLHSHIYVYSYVYSFHPQSICQMFSWLISFQESNVYYMKCNESTWTLRSTRLHWHQFFADNRKTHFKWDRKKIKPSLFVRLSTNTDVALVEINPEITVNGNVANPFVQMRLSNIKMLVLAKVFLMSRIHKCIKPSTYSADNNTKEEDRKSNVWNWCHLKSASWVIKSADWSSFAR